uniref:Putative pdz domain-containing protein n=1 Tax=Culex tarsalis TaxID=7177 RepID=A0A1Q3EVX3_CULTA
MADYCNVRSGGSAASTFRSPTVFHHAPRHHTLTRTSGGGVGGPDRMDGGDRLVGTMDGGSQRVRTVRLCRPQNFGSHHFQVSGNFGFSIRGGLEYGTGFFVSAIEKDSEADRQGLRVGDQIVRVNGYQVDDAVHRELAQFVANQERLVLKVRSVGIIPVKERSGDPLTWHVVSSTTGKHRDDSRTSCSSTSSASSSSGGTLEEMLPPGRDIKVILSVAPRTKLGCGICKGPEWKPGIFVQFTKEGGVAREAGLRPGDQILSCNGREFADITFAEAVSIMKASHVLELVVRPGAGIDMFPGESSGYNSSASSVNGDQSPCWGDSAAKRLSIVREESISNGRGKDREKSGPKSGGTVSGRRNNTTIIEFSENGTVVNNSLISDNTKKTTDSVDGSKEGSSKLADICFVSKQSETKTIIVEVHRSASTNSVATNGSGGSNIPPPPPLFADKIPPPPPPNGLNGGKSGGLGTNRQQRSPSAVSLADSSASSGIADCGPSSGGLGNAISEELKRRAQKQTPSISSLCSPNALEPAAALTELENRLKEKRLKPTASVAGPPGTDAARHSALMDEFKAVHKRMFKNGFDNAELKRAPSKDKLPIEVRPPAVAPAPPTTSQSKGTMGRVAATEMARASGDIAELESIESFKLTNPSPKPVRPPSYYFCPQGTGPATMKKSQKPIAVTISEYQREAPRKPAGSVGNLKHELEKTLSLSNLRQRSESREDLVERIQISGGGRGDHEQVKLSRSSSVANVGGRSSTTSVSNGNRITIAISNSGDKKK